MKLVTFNVNGIRAADRRGFRFWLEATQPDVLALQEVRCPVEALPEGIFDGYHLVYDPGQLAGRNGVALLSRTPPINTRIGLTADSEFAHEGRYIEADYEIGGMALTVASLYLPKGAVPEDRLGSKASEPAAGASKYERKMRFCDTLAAHLVDGLARAQGAERAYTILGDYNIARTPLDLANNKSRVPLDGYLPEERDWLTKTLEIGLVDVVRQLHGEVPGPYSWWSWRAGSWDRGTGWRIDYHLSSPDLAARATWGDTDKAKTYESRISDHAPVIVEYQTPGEAQ
ncbi:MAG: exodeoxyribonuclease III [Propionibacteriaceae bacterium]|jgi:exodeoxyribonuclease-3|nr:exodeoxyribonuclease III [Propionibacteriaceae bacterium]